MRKPNLAIYYFKNALDRWKVVLFKSQYEEYYTMWNWKCKNDFLWRLDSSQGGEGSRVPGGESSSWLTQAQVDNFYDFCFFDIETWQLASFILRFFTTSVCHYYMQDAQV